MTSSLSSTLTQLAGKTAIVTGASRGIGSAISRALAAQGVRVALVARSQPSLEALAQEIGNKAFAAPCDLTQTDAVHQMAEMVAGEFGGAPDIIVNNAGVFDLALLHDVTTSDFEAAIQTNLTAPFLLIREFLGRMRERASGHIITIGSIADRNVMPENGAYSAAKYGLRALHEVLRIELNGTGVRATLVSPGAVDTELWDSLLSTPGPEGRMLPSREQMLKPSALADAVLYVASQPQTVNVDELRLSHS